jgi:hypothetical protein
MLPVMAEFHRAANTMNDPMRIALTIERASCRRLTEMADAARVSRSQMTQWLIDTIQLRPDGLPVGWPESSDDDEELPMAG